MKSLLITLALSMPAMAADENKEQQPDLDCGEKYTMYTHPDNRCREQLRQEYQALIKAYLKYKAANLKSTGEIEQKVK